MPAETTAAHAFQVNIEIYTHLSVYDAALCMTNRINPSRLPAFTDIFPAAHIAPGVAESIGKLGNVNSRLWKSVYFNSSNIKSTREHSMGAELDQEDLRGGFGP